MKLMMQIQILDSRKKKEQKLITMHFITYPDIMIRSFCIQATVCFGRVITRRSQLRHFWQLLEPQARMKELQKLCFSKNQLLPENNLNN